MVVQVNDVVRMVRAEDLRLRNWVLSLGKDGVWYPSIVSKITTDEIVVGVGFVRELKPIVLTDKILADLGGHILPFINGIIFDRFRFIWRENYKYWYVIDNQEETYITKIEFVHEFQNFIRFVNGQELNVKF